MQKPKRKIKDSFLLIQLLDSRSLSALNKKFNTHYTKKQVKKNVRIQRDSKRFKFWDRLMKTPPGYGRDGGD